MHPWRSQRRTREGSGFTLEDVRAAGGSVRVPMVMAQYKKWEKGLLREDGSLGFATPSGKFEIASSILAEHGYDALPVYTEPGEGPIAQPKLAERCPLVFNSGARVFADFRSQHHGVRPLNELAPEPLVSLNTMDATGRGIEDGDSVWVETSRGKVKFRARVTDDIVAGAIEANMGGGGPLGPSVWKECNVNELTDLERYDPISGFPVYKALLCDVIRAEGPGRRTARVAERGEDAVARQAAVRTESPDREVYLDHNASTPVDPEVLDAMMPFLTKDGGNPSSIHGRGMASRDAIEGARRKLAALINCTARRIVFTGGGSEADNLAIKGVALALSDKGRHLITSSVEHPAVLGACQALSEFGFETTVLPVLGDGRVNPAALAAAIRPETVLVSVMLANNELGTVQPVMELAKLARERGVLFHTDAVQGLGKIPVDTEELGVDLLSVSAHKLYGPKGVGALYMRSGVRLTSLIHGGGQERMLRAGTENVPGIVGFGKACELARKRLSAGEPARVATLRDRLEASLCRRVRGARVNGSTAERTPNTTNMVLPGMRGESLVLALDRYGVYFSSGSACKSGNPDPSHGLRAIGLSDEDAHCSIRLSLGYGTSDSDVDYVLETFERVIRESQDSVRFVGCR